MKIRSSSAAGFSLVEVVFALAVVVFCLVSVMGLLTLGITTSQSSSAQTTASNILNQVAADLQATPNLTSSSPSARDSTVENSPYYGIPLPANAYSQVTQSGAVATSTPPSSPYYFTDDGIPTTAANAFYQLNVYITSPGVNNGAVQQETFVRLLITWPAQAAITNAQGSLDQVIAINRT